MPIGDEMNIFEGCRRIAFIIGLLGVVISLTSLYGQKPYVEYKSFVAIPNQLLTEVSNCPDDVKSRVKILRAEDDANAYTWLCTANPTDFVMLPKGQDEGLEQTISNQRWKDRGVLLGQILAGVMLWYGFVWVVGWIARGFLGIPRGQDYRVGRTQPQ
jgi:hypothetical protein